MIKAIIGRQFADKVIPLIDEAKTSIDIIVFDWRWYTNDAGSSVQLFNQSIVRAVRRGVCVRAIVNHSGICNTLNSLGCVARKLETKNLVHAKMMVLDSEIVVVGSHNYTQHAFTMNYELSVILQAPENISDFSNFFNQLWPS